MKNKQYNITDSCLYKCYDIDKLCQYLKCTKADIEQIIQGGNDAYIKRNIEKVKAKVSKGKIEWVTKPRSCETPKDKILEQIHGRIKYFLQSIETPDYLFSGKKGKSTLMMVQYHEKNANQYLVKLDIEKFFPSVTLEHIYYFFNKIMQCSVPVSDIITKLCTYDERLPTGCKMSMHLAYFTHKKCFDEIDIVAKQNDCIYSVWVDDIIISGKLAKKVGSIAKRIISKSGLKCKGEKDIVYKPYQSKEVVGIMLNSDGSKDVPNKIKFQIFDSKQNGDINRLRGLKQYKKQVCKNNESL